MPEELFASVKTYPRFERGWNRLQMAIEILVALIVLSGLLGLFGGIALLLMAAGVYGLIVFTVSQRMPEMGVRVALGAGRRQVFRLILRDGLLLAVTGVLIGAGSAALLAQVVGSEVFGLGAALPSTLAAVLTVVLAVVAAGDRTPGGDARTATARRL